MIVLDLFSEASPQWSRTNSYYGKNWVWCLLHGIVFDDCADIDFGGVLGLEGNLPDLTAQPLFARDHTSTMTGIGITMEGQEGNEVVVFEIEAHSDCILASISSSLVKYINRFCAVRRQLD
jgi:alpha-N-acetylglucosaminidase